MQGKHIAALAQPRPASLVQGAMILQAVLLLVAVAVRFAPLANHATVESAAAHLVDVNCSSTTGFG